MKKTRKFEIVERNLDKAEKIIDKVKKDYQQGYVKVYAYALHDKDTYTEDELIRLREDCEDNQEQLKQYADLKPGDLKKPHYHIGIQLKNAAEFGTVANHYQCDVNMVTVIKSHYFKDYLTYLVHGNRPNKYQYPLSVVRTSEEGYEKLIESTITSYFVKHVKDVKDAYLERIRNGEWKLNYISSLSFERAKNEDDKYLCVMWQQYKKPVEQAYQTYISSQYDLSDLGRKVFFIQGAGGIGKTNYVYNWLDKNNIPRSELYEAGENDPLGHYLNESVVMFDDYRPNTLKFTQLLNCTDPNFAHIIDARYFDKRLTAKYIFITSSMSFEEWVSWFRRYKPMEDISQWLRRVSYLIDTKETEMDVYVNHFYPISNNQVDKELEIEGQFIKNHFEKWQTIENTAAKFDREQAFEDLKKPDFKM